MGLSESFWPVLFLLASLTVCLKFNSVWTTARRQRRREMESSSALQIVLAPVLLRGGAMEVDGNKWILK